MIKKQKELLNESEIDIVKNSNYKKQFRADKYRQFEKINSYNYNNSIIKKNMGKEVRTFNIIDQSKPLLSPSRIMKVFSEHKWCNIPQKSLMLPRLLGQLTHKLLELRVINKTPVVLDKDNLESLVGEDIVYIDDWIEIKKELFIKDVNRAVSTIQNYLNDKNIVILSVEKYICNTEYHGYIDMVGYIQYSGGNKSPIIIDLKTTTIDKVQNSHIAQLSIYRHLYEDIPQCYILLYNRNNDECRLEKLSWKELDSTFEKIDGLNRMLRGK